MMGIFDYVNKLADLRDQQGTGGQAGLGTYAARPPSMRQGGLSSLDTYRTVSNAALSGLGAAAAAASHGPTGGAFNGSVNGLSGNTLVDRILAGIRQQESGGDYNVRSRGEPWDIAARGAYQFIPSTYQGLANRYGMNGSDWSPANQDAIARRYVTDLLSQNGNDPRQVAANWYTGHSVTDGNWNYVPYPSAGNTLTIGAYAQRLIDYLNGH